MDTLAARLKDLREKAGKSAIELSTSAGLGKNTVNEIEKDPDRSPRLEVVKRLADALGVSLSYLADGETGNEPSHGFHESQASPFVFKEPAGQRPDLLDPLRKLPQTLAPNARNPSPMRLNVGLPDLGLLAGDILIVDLNARAKDGDIVVANVVDMSNGSASTVVRRLFSPYLVSPRMDEEQPVMIADGSRTVIMGVVAASCRVPDIG